MIEIALHGGEYGGHEGTHHLNLFDTLLRGMAWRTGGDIANLLFHTAPGAVVLLVLAVLVVGGVRRLRRRMQR